MRTLRVLHVTPYSADAWAYGGIPRVVGSLARGLARRGHHVTVCATDVCDEVSRLPRGLHTPSERIRVRMFPNISNTLAYRFQLYLPVGLDAYLKEAVRSFDIAHIHACRNLPGVIAARRLRQAGVPYVLAPHGTAPNIECWPLAKRVVDVLAGTRVLSGAARLVAVSRAEQRQLEQVGVDPNIIRLIPAPVDVDEFPVQRTRGAFRQRCGLNDEPLVLFLGQLTPRKRIDVLVRALARLSRSESRLVIAGNDRGATATAVAEIERLGLQSRTQFVGLLRGDDRLQALADADVVVYPSEHEVFGLVPLEALLCGTPVIVADDSGCAEVIRATGGGMVTAVGNTEALAHAIDEVLASKTAWRVAVTEAARRVRRMYDVGAVCAATERIYHEVAGTSCVMAEAPLLQPTRASGMA